MIRSPRYMGEDPYAEGQVGGVVGTYRRLARHHGFAHVKAAGVCGSASSLARLITDFVFY